MVQSSSLPSIPPSPGCDWHKRVPVRIHLTQVPPEVLISAGMTCTVVMKEGAAPKLGLGIRKVMTTVFGAPSR
jgi:hypothetical protein